MRTAHGEKMPRAEQMAAYGAVNALGFHGDPEVKARLLRSLTRAIDRGDWNRVLHLAFSYGAGSVAGSLLRPTAERIAAELDAGGVRWE